MPDPLPVQFTITMAKPNPDLITNLLNRVKQLQTDCVTLKRELKILTDCKYDVFTNIIPECNRNINTLDGANDTYSDIKTRLTNIEANIIAKRKDNTRFLSCLHHFRVYSSGTSCPWEPSGVYNNTYITW